MKALKIVLIGLSIVLAASKSDATTTHHFYTEDPQAYVHVLLYGDGGTTDEPVPPHTVRSKSANYSGQFLLGDGHFNLTLDEANRRYYFDLLFTKPADTNPIYPYLPEFFTATSVSTSADNPLPTEFGYGYDPETEVISISQGPVLEFDSFEFPELDISIGSQLNSSSSRGFGGKMKFAAWTSMSISEIPGTNIMEVYVSIPSLKYGKNTTEVPEPSTMLLSLAGMAGLLYRKRLST